MVSLSAKGLTTGEISAQLTEIYGAEVSKQTIGDIASNRRDEQKLSMLCLRILQSVLVYVNTLVLQDVLAEPVWSEQLTPEDKCVLISLFGITSHPTARYAWI